MSTPYHRVLLKLSGEVFGGGGVGVDPHVVDTKAKEIAEVVAVVGATATGKSDLALDLAERLDGDIVNIDHTVIVDGWHGDSSRMYLAGDVPIKARRLVEVTYECLMLGIEMAKPGNTVGDIGHAIQTYAEAQRCSMVQDFCGHGLGRVFQVEVGRRIGRRRQGRPLFLSRLNMI